MKKLIALVLVLSLFLPAAFAENAPEPDEVWYAIIVAVEGQYVPVYNYGIDAKLFLYADGSCVSENSSQNGTYSLTGTFEWQDNTLVVSFPDMADAQYTLDDDGYLRYTGASSVTFYTRNPEEYAKYVPAPVVEPEAAAAESEDAFLGLWALNAVYLRHTQYTPEEANIFLALSINQGHITLYDDTAMESVAADYETEFADQGLHFLMEEGTDEEHVLSRLYLTTDGNVMTTYLTRSDEALTMVFIPVEQAE